MGVPVATISSDGRTLDSSIELLSLEIHRELNRIPEATLILLDGSLAERRFRVSDLAFFLPGAPITIALRYEEDPSDITVFEGLVVRHAVERSGDHSNLRIELKDQAFVLTRGRHSAVFRDTTDTDVFTSMIRNAGLNTGSIEPTTTKQLELVQYNATDWDFLVSRAEVLGLGVTVHRGEISVRRLGLGSPRRRLDHGIDDVSEISLEIDGSHQWAAISGIGWDLTNGKATAPEAAKQPEVQVGNLNAPTLATALGGEQEILLHPAVFQPGELKDWASARLLRSRFAMLRGRAMVAGDASLEPLDTVEILGVGDRFNGKALVSAVTHTLDENGWKSELRLGLPPEPFASRPDLADLPAAGLLPPCGACRSPPLDRWRQTIRSNCGCRCCCRRFPMTRAISGQGSLLPMPATGADSCSGLRWGMRWCWDFLMTILVSRWFSERCTAAGILRPARWRPPPRATISGPW